MKIDWTVYYEDGSSGVVGCEKPPGAHPESLAAVMPAIHNAERTGKVVRTIGRSVLVRGHLIDRNMVARQDAFEQARLTAPHLLTPSVPNA